MKKIKKNVNDTDYCYHANCIFYKNIVSYILVIFMIGIPFWPIILGICTFIPLILLLPLYVFIFMFIIIPGLSLNIAIYKFVYYRFKAKEKKSIKHYFNLTLNNFLLDSNNLLITYIISITYNILIIYIFGEEIVKPSYDLSFVMYIFILGVILTISYCYKCNVKLISKKSLGCLILIILWCIITKVVIFIFIPFFLWFIGPNQFECVYFGGPPHFNLEPGSEVTFNSVSWCYNALGQKRVYTDLPIKQDIIVPSQEIIPQDNHQQGLDTMYSCVRGWSFLPYDRTHFASDLYFPGRNSPIPAYKVNDDTFSFGLKKGLSSEIIWKNVCMYQNAIESEKQGLLFSISHLFAVNSILEEYTGKNLFTFQMTYDHKTYVKKIYLLIGQEETSNTICAHDRVITIEMAQAMTLRCLNAYNLWYINYSDHVDSNKLYLVTKDNEIYLKNLDETRLLLTKYNRKIRPDGILHRDHVKVFKEAFAKELERRS